MKVLNEYDNHHYIQEFEKSDLFCPHCGTKEVWEEQSEGDYYTGPDFICATCSHEFSIQGPRLKDSTTFLKKLDQLRSGITLEPTTPQGH